jgi:hypothetical protein
LHDLRCASTFLERCHAIPILFESIRDNVAYVRLIIYEEYVLHVAAMIADGCFLAKGVRP